MKIAIVGASGHGGVVADILRDQDGAELVGFIDDGRSKGHDVMGFPVIGGTIDIPTLVESGVLEALIVAIGDNAVRETVTSAIEESWPDAVFATAIHASAHVASNAEIGAGSVIAACANVGPQTRVGKHCIVSTGASVDHDSSLDDFASLAPGAITGGGCHIGVRSAICIGATLIHGLRVHNDAVIGAGSLVLNDIPPLSLAYGSPAKVARSRTKGERYL